MPTPEHDKYLKSIFGVDPAAYRLQDSNGADASSGDSAVAPAVAGARPPGAGHGQNATPVETSDGTIDVKGRPKGPGWQKTNVIILLTNYDGTPMSGHEVEVQFKAPGAEVISAGGSMDGGTLTLSDVWLQKEGTVFVMAISKNTPAIVPTGNKLYSSKGAGLLKISGVQRGKDITVTAKTSEEAAEKAGVQGTLGIDYKVVKAEGEASAESENKKGSEVTYNFVVTIGTTAIDLTIS